VVVVAGLDREPNWNRLDRELVLAWDSGARPVVAFNKVDLDVDREALGARASERLGGVEVLMTSAVTGEGIEALAALARPDRTIVFLGASGVGKSSLVNALVGDRLLEVGEVREGDRRGRHTTTARYLIPLPGGGVLLDTPGVRSLGVADAHEGLSVTFADIEALAQSCRFRDCAHESEPGCAVRAAVETGALSAERMASWQKLGAEMAWLEAREDPAEAAARRRDERRVHRAYRKVPKR
jgi:ribosome biogenesis GTPase